MFKDIASEHQLNRYLKFIDSCKNQKIEGYYEKHHIIPRSLGGTDEATNLVKLNARQHFIAHLMLSKMFKGQSAIKMHHAVWNMVNRDKGVRTTSRTYEVLKQQRSKLLSVMFAGENNPMYGKTLTTEHKQAISKRLKGKPKPEGHGEKISLRVRGSGNPQYGKPKTQKQIDAVRKAALDNNPMKRLEVVEKIKQAKSGTINCYDLILNKFSRVTKEIFNSSDRYVGTTSKLIPKEL
jgi:stress-induced morphogen